ncbi:MAG: ATP-binding protein [Treponema sp.]|uniref:AAA family ATPase n=1 Tax=Treponema sp. TaxID=166 RepID=UPI0025EF24A2|nr:AAA family ATPase [Treponema sp.]MBQ9281796.1 ATP-binding protein [Treponema sp.]
MAKLRVKNFGPIKDGFSENDGFMEITPVTVICGNQATGKSTIAKLYSTLTWLEKSYVKSSLGKKTIPYTDFVSYCAEQRLQEYFTDSTEIQYIGETIVFTYKNNAFSQELVKDFDIAIKNYNRPKIMYVPAERNLLAAIDSAENIKNLPLMLSVLLEEYNKARKNSETKIFTLPISNIKLVYDSHALSTKVLTDNGEIDILNSSSGIQSVAPLSLVTRFLTESVRADFLENLKGLSVNERNQIKDWLSQNYENQEAAGITLNLFDQLLYGQKISDSLKKEISMLLHFFFNTRFINIVEEPEQNLYPESQGKVLYELLECLNTNGHNQLIITTHSPYMLSYLTQSAKADELLKKGVPAERIEKIVPVKSAVASEKISIYETKEDGSIKLLKPYENLPSDENLLNAALADGNERFSKLLDLEVAFCK